MNKTLLSERLWEIERELSVNAEDLIKEEDNYEDGEAENDLLSLAREYRKIDNQESRDELDIWVEFFLQRKQIYKEKISKIEGSVASINCGTRRSLNWDYGSYRAISIAKFSKVETLSLAPIICLF
ncbi:putative transcriptional regulator [Wolbachia endosymbiont of Culex quinquefasciatus JHB]|uniref:hypothetical protein n=1 Tax=Wolbachia endosymbiont of Culex quinquefasciatus TaxID=263437 RepID=UPI0001848414|nr:hypothetical protein [Wolbachia endosymbiont of Culex quinquefasciatus]EEB55316.1 putative transcriptional regulator [Wolbachia endosymbiont of Culex quinquefasciatus JHB]